MQVLKRDSTARDWKLDTSGISCRSRGMREIERIRLVESAETVKRSSNDLPSKLSERLSAAMRSCRFFR
jgi:hypothetical protein